MSSLLRLFVQNHVFKTTGNVSAEIASVSISNPNPQNGRHKKVIYVPKFKAVLCTIAKRWKAWPSQDEWIKKINMAYTFLIKEPLIHSINTGKT